MADISPQLTSRLFGKLMLSSCICWECLECLPTRESFSCCNLTNYNKNRLKKQHAPNYLMFAPNCYFFLFSSVFFFHKTLTNPSGCSLATPRRDYRTEIAFALQSYFFFLLPIFLLLPIITKHTELMYRNTNRAGEDTSSSNAFLIAI